MSTFTTRLNKYKTLSDVRREASESTQGLTAYQIRVATAEYAEACEDARDALSIRLVLERAYSQAREDEMSARLMYDQYQAERSHPGVDAQTIAEENEDDSTPVKKWRRGVDAAFTSYPTMTVFPSPPVHTFPHHHSLTCRTRQRYSLARSLEACDCAIRRAFQSLDVCSISDERLRWHPDRFAMCPAEVRFEFQRKAQEVFDVLDMMYQQALHLRPI